MPPKTLFLAAQSDPAMIKSIVDAVTIPVMAKVRIGHFVEAQASHQLQYRDVFTRVLIMVLALFR
jgi:pyridoxal 5'-phosphate synthase pdxS subunit